MRILSGGRITRTDGSAFATLAVLAFIVFGICSDLFLFIKDVAREVYMR